MGKNIVLLSLIILLSFAQATMTSANLVLLAIVSFGVLFSVRAGLVWAFLAGVVLDIIVGKNLGFSSLIFLLTILLLNLYKTKFKAANFFYLLPFTFLSVWFYNLSAGVPFVFLNVVLTTALLFLIWPVIGFLGYQKIKDNLQLPLKL